MKVEKDEHMRERQWVLCPVCRNGLGEAPLEAGDVHIASGVRLQWQPRG